MKTHALKLNLKLDANNTANYNFGIHMRYQNNFANPATGVRRLIPDYNKYDAGLFAISNLKWGNHTDINFGLRYDFNRIDAKKFYLNTRWEERNYNKDFSNIIIKNIGNQILVNPIYNFHNLSFSTGMSHDISTQQKVLLNYGISQRSPNPSELFSDGLHQSVARIELGDLRMKQETSNRFGASYLLKLSKLSLNTEGFVNYIKDFMQIVPFGIEQNIGGPFPVWNYIQTNAILFGIDITANYKFDEQWSLNNKSSFIKARDTKEKEAIIDIPAFRTVNVLGYKNKKWLDVNANIESE